MTIPRLGVRSRLLAAIVVAVAVALVLAVAVFSFLLGQRLDASATSLARTKAEAAVSSLEIRDDALVAPEWPDEDADNSKIWVFAGSSVLEAPNATQEVDAAARSLVAGTERSLDVGDEARLYAIPVVRENVRYGTVVAAVPLAPYEETGHTALIGSFILAVLVLCSVTLLSWWMLGRALLPVSRMTEDAAAWGEQDLDRRFGLGEPYDELTRLAATLDNLLERIAASLRHEQRLTAELSHELRTPLARIHGQAELMLSRERAPDEYRSALAAILSNAAQMTRTVETLVSAARQEAGLVMTTSDLRDAVQAAVSNVRESGTAVEFRVTLPSQPARVAVDEELMERMIQPLVDNAARYGRAFCDVSLARDGGIASVHVVDDGPGVAADEQATIFEPGVRGKAAEGRADGAGLGLPLARRLARSAGGEISGNAASTGAHFTLSLPLVG